MSSREAKPMHALQRVVRRSLWLSSVSVAALLAAGCAQQSAQQQMASAAPSGSNVTLSGNQEVPPVSTARRAPAPSPFSWTVGEWQRDHFRRRRCRGPHSSGCAWSERPVIVPLNKTGDNVWSVPPAIRLNDAQYEAYRLGTSTSTCIAPPIQRGNSRPNQALTRLNHPR